MTGRASVPAQAASHVVDGSAIDAAHSAHSQPGDIDRPGQRSDPAASGGLVLREAGPRDITAAAMLIGDAFAGLDASAWLVPAYRARPRVLARVFSIVVEHALDHGSVDLLTDPFPALKADVEGGRPGAGLVGVAVWVYRDDPDWPVLPVDYDARLHRAADPYTHAFQHLDDLFDSGHPTELPHHHLALLAVHPAQQGRGHGTRLLDHHHRLLDRHGIAAYLEASNQASAALYARHGYRPHGPDLRLPDGTPFHPMWREPHPQRKVGG